MSGEPNFKIGSDDAERRTIFWSVLLKSERLTAFSILLASTYRRGSFMAASPARKTEHESKTLKRAELSR